MKRPQHRGCKKDVVKPATHNASELSPQSYDGRLDPENFRFWQSAQKRIETFDHRDRTAKPAGSS